MLLPRTRRFGPVAFSFLCLFAAPLGTGCDARPDRGGGEGPGHRPQRLALTPQQELELGREAYQEILSHPGKFGHVIPADRPECQRVRRIASRIIHAVDIEPLRREMNLREGYQFEWEVNVLDRDDVNAFCLPGGKMAVFRGILRVAENDDQVATVLSHEIAHALAHHTSERVARAGLDRGFGGIWSKAFDRQEEAEADHIGVFLMTFAGYDPDEAVRFWERMQHATGGRGLPEILSDHPSDAHRIQNMKGWVPLAQAALKALKEGNIAPAPRR